MVATYNNIATNLTKVIRKNIKNTYSERQYDDSNFLDRLAINSQGNLKPNFSWQVIICKLLVLPLFTKR